MLTAICQTGPTVIQRLAGDTAPSATAETMLADAALDGGDGRFVLVEDRPVALREVWQAVLRPLLIGADRAVLVHPSWWPAPRVDAVRAAVGDLVGEIDVLPRWRVWALSHGAVVIEIAPEVVMLRCDGAPVGLWHRSAAVEVVAGEITESVLAQSVLARGADRPVIIDAPQQVPGAEAMATRLAAGLAAARLRVVTAGDGQFDSAARALVPSQAEIGVESARAGNRPWRRWRSPVAAAGIVAVAVVGIAVGNHDDPGDRPAEVPTSALVEGRLTMQVPAGWTVRRVTDGPGSARVEVLSPAEPELMLHLTQSRVSSGDLAETATALRNAVDAEAAGVFVDFNPSDTRAGRRAVTYREVRPGRDITWTVLVDGDLRMSIGCQYPTGRAASVGAACDDAVRSVRRIR